MTAGSGPAGSYRLGEPDAAEAEARRLRAQAGAIWERELAALQRAGLRPGQRLLEVGCGPGMVLERLGGTIGRAPFGADIDGAFVSRAAAHGRLLRADGAALPFADESFDFVLFRLVLRHAPAREALLAEAARVAVVGGVVCAVDVDEGATTIDPAPPSWAALKAALVAAAERRGGDPFVGRRLPRLLSAVGLSDVATSMLPVSTDDLPPAAFVETMLAPAARAVDPDLLAPEAVAAAWAALREWAAGGPGFGYALGIVTAGRKPFGWRKRTGA
jgi:ubiquinone/menaquinone biosynthesis C-methylase UbiE